MSWDDAVLWQAWAKVAAVVEAEPGATTVEREPLVPRQCVVRAVGLGTAWESSLLQELPVLVESLRPSKVESRGPLVGPLAGAKPTCLQVVVEVVTKSFASKHWAACQCCCLVRPISEVRPSPSTLVVEASWEAVCSEDLGQIQMMIHPL